MLKIWWILLCVVFLSPCVHTNPSLYPRCHIGSLKWNKCFCMLTCLHGKGTLPSMKLCFHACAFIVSVMEWLSPPCYVFLCFQIISWWYSVRTSASHSSASGHTGRSNGQSEVAAHACASMCDEMVVLWRLAVLDPNMSPYRLDNWTRTHFSAF